MTNAYELRNHFFLEDYNTAITREDFELLHQDEKRHLHLQRLGRQELRRRKPKANVYRTIIKGFESVRLIKVGKGLHYIEEDHEVLERPPASTTREPAGWSMSREPKRMQTSKSGYRKEAQMGCLS